MTIDVLINSCARPDILEVSLNTFMEKIKTNKHDFRYVLVEDKVNNDKRQQKGAKWIEKHRDFFDEVWFAQKKMGPGFFFAPAVSLCKSNHFFHLEDDNKFIKDVNIDTLLDVLDNNDYIIEIMMSRGPINPAHQPRKTEIDGVKLTESSLFSVATGVFNTSLVKQLIDAIGWDKPLHEAKTLTPMSKKIGLRKFVLGHDEQHYVHVGAERGYKKGAWK